MDELVHIDTSQSGQQNGFYVTTTQTVPST